MISLMYAGNTKIFDGLLISVISVAEHTKEPLDIHLLTADYREIDERFTPLTERHRAFLETLVKEYHSDSRVTRHEPNALFKSFMDQSPNLHSPYTPYTMLRLVADQLPLPDKVLYLDTDTAAIGDVAQIYGTDISGYDYAGVKDYLGRVFIHPRYINAGVLLLNLAEIRKSGLFQRARHFCGTKKTPFPDQDAINRLEKHKYFLPRGYNEQRKMRKDTVIRHFSKSIRWIPFFHTVNIKPWDIENLHAVYHNYAFDDVLAVYRAKRAAFDGLTAAEANGKDPDPAEAEPCRLSGQTSECPCDGKAGA